MYIKKLTDFWNHAISLLLFRRHMFLQIFFLFSVINRLFWKSNKKQMFRAELWLKTQSGRSLYDLFSVENPEANGILSTGLGSAGRPEMVHWNVCHAIVEILLYYYSSCPDKYLHGNFSSESSTKKHSSFIIHHIRHSTAISNKKKTSFMINTI